MAAPRAPTLTSGRSYLALRPNHLGVLSFFDISFSCKDCAHNPTLPLSNPEPLVPLHSKRSPADSHALHALCRGEPDLLLNAGG